MGNPPPSAANQSEPDHYSTDFAPIDARLARPGPRNKPQWHARMLRPSEPGVNLARGRQLFQFQAFSGRRPETRSGFLTASAVQTSARRLSARLAPEDWPRRELTSAGARQINSYTNKREALYAFSSW